MNVINLAVIPNIAAFFLSPLHNVSIASQDDVSKSQPLDAADFSNWFNFYFCISPSS